MLDKKLSVLITFCNQKAFIKDAIESTVKQKVNFDYEILIGLEGDDIESEKIIENYISQYANIRLFKINTSNIKTIAIEKASLNRLNLLKHARGEYFCLLDGDDFYSDENRMQKMVDILDKRKDIIGAAHDYIYYDNKNDKKIAKQSIFNQEKTFCAKDYIQSGEHIAAWNFVFRNIFDGQIPPDLETSFFNDSTILHYMFKYGNIFYTPVPMIMYRVNVTSIYNSKNKILQDFYALLGAEMNLKTIPAHINLLCKKYKKHILNCFSKYHHTDISSNSELQIIKQFAKQHDCYFTYTILNFPSTSLTEKLLLFKRLLSFIVSCKYPHEKTCRALYYFSKRPNFGDELNLYIIQRLLNINVKKADSAKNAQLLAIGSILGTLVSSRQKIDYLYRPPVKIWGSGFIEDPKGKYWLRRKIEPVAIRGFISKKKLEQLSGKKYNNIPLGDPGLLCSLLIEQGTIVKKHKVGVLLHYADKNNEAIKNIKLDNYKLIDVCDNPIKVLRQISECEVILSSAMHGLITADSLNIPNQWIRLSDKLTGQNYKFEDYYSVYNKTSVQPIDLRTSAITDLEVEQIKQNYINENRKIIVDKINKNLMNAAKFIC